MKVELLLAAATVWLVIGVAGQYAVGDRAPSPSPGVPHATATRPVLDSETAPARPLVDGGEDVVPLEEIQAMLPVLAALPAGPASTVVVQALNHALGVAEQADAPAAGRDGGDPNAGSRPATGGAMVVTAVATARPVVTQAVESSNSALIAASPWPVHLHATVACLVQRESRWVATAVGAAGERGILQVHPITWPYLAQHGITPDMLFDPATNLRAGYLLYLEAGGLGPWNGACA